MVDYVLDEIHEMRQDGLGGAKRLYFIPVAQYLSRVHLYLPLIRFWKSLIQLASSPLVMMRPSTLSVSIGT
jgi:hypothetical protein